MVLSLKQLNLLNMPKRLNVPIVVAINKCDLPEADPNKIKNQLLEHELIAEELSGEILWSKYQQKLEAILINLLSL